MTFRDLNFGLAGHVGRHLALLLLALLGVGALPLMSAKASTSEIAALQNLIADARSNLNVSPEETIVLSEKASRLAGKSLSGSERDSLQAEADAVIGRALIALRRVDEADIAVTRGFARTKGGQIAPRIVGELTLASGRIYQYRDDVQHALSAFQKAYGLFRSVGEKRSQALALQSIAKLYVDGGDGKSAIKYYTQSDEEYGGDPLMSLSSRTNRGRALLLLLKPAAAEAEFKEALAIAERIGSEKYVPRVLSNIAQAQIAQAQFKNASGTLDRAFASLAAADSTDEAWTLWRMRAQISLARKGLKTAVAQIETALKGVDPKTSDTSFRDAHDTAYEVYRASGRQRDALVQLEAARRLDDATAKLTASTAAALMAARFDFASQKTRIAQLKAKELQLQRNFLIVVIAGGAIVLLLLSVGLILITRSRNRERAAKLLLAQTNRDLEKAIAAKMEFLATTSHEIRTPLNGILGMTQVMLTDRKMDATLRDRIGIVHDAGETMRALVDDILDVAKMETGKLAVGSGTVDLKTTLRHVAQVWRLQAEAAGVELALRLDDCPEAIEGDAGRIRQIIFNLLSNAMKFTENGKVELAVDSNMAGRIRISVRDSGIGIDRKWHESIFELFRQVDGGTTRKYGGTGLGLAICRNLARAMGGDITVESEPGFGSTFTLDLPLIEAAPVSARSRGGERPSTVLVIEHNPLTRGMVRAILTERFEAITFVDGVAEACAFLALDEADWILADAASVEDFAPLFAATEVPIALIADEHLTDDITSKAAALLRKPLTKSALLSVFGQASQPAAVAA